MNFSDRYGYTSIRDTLQLESINKELQNLIWNLILKTFLNDNILSESGRLQFLKHIWSVYLKRPSDEINVYNQFPQVIIYRYLKDYFFSCKWYEIYNLLEELCRLEDAFTQSRSLKSAMQFKNKLNDILKQELAGYRVIDNKIVQVTKEEEVTEIEDAIKNTDKYNSVNQHLKTAINHFSNKQKPDYRNSIKESISAIESICKIIAKNEKATLYDALKEIEKRHSIHKALKSSFASLYDFTSGAGGIRHALLEKDIKVGLEEARFILISSSAFINFLISKYDID